MKRTSLCASNTPRTPVQFRSRRATGKSRALASITSPTRSFSLSRESSADVGSERFDTRPVAVNYSAGGGEPPDRSHESADDDPEQRFGDPVR